MFFFWTRFKVFVSMFNAFVCRFFMVSFKYKTNHIIKNYHRPHGIYSFIYTRFVCFFMVEGLLKITFIKIQDQSVAYIDYN